jgi:hypothetical protein
MTSSSPHTRRRAGSPFASANSTVSSDSVFVVPVGGRTEVLTKLDVHVRALLDCHAQFLATVTAAIVVITANQDLTSSRLLPGIISYAAYGRSGCELTGHRASKIVLNDVLVAWMVRRTIQRQAKLLLAASLDKIRAVCGPLMVPVPLNQCKDTQLQMSASCEKPLIFQFLFLAPANFKVCKKSPPIQYAHSLLYL